MKMQGKSRILFHDRVHPCSWPRGLMVLPDGFSALPAGEDAGQAGRRAAR